MRNCLRFAVWLGLISGANVMTADEKQPIVIAHRGASAYLPEHTLPAKAMAFAMGADYLEQDVVLSKDGVPFVLHDTHLDTVTDVARRFPQRARDDGRFYALDFTAEEIQQLQAHERIDIKTGKPVYPNRFGLGKGRFHVPTLREELELIRELNRTSEREAGVYVEIKSPAWHRRQGVDPSVVVLKLLREFGYRNRADRCFVQCFDPSETRRLRRELKCELRLVQLIGGKKDKTADYERMRTQSGLAEIAEYADGIGPNLDQLVVLDDRGVKPHPLIQWAHDANLVIHPYTFRADSLPKFVDRLEADKQRQFTALLRFYFEDLQIDGLFTDFPDRAVAARKQR